MIRVELARHSTTTLLSPRLTSLFQGATDQIIARYWLQEEKAYIDELGHKSHSLEAEVPCALLALRG